MRLELVVFRISARTLAIAAAIVLSWLIVAPPVVAQAYWSLAEAQPEVPNGGRVDSIAINPANSSIVLVASESGGLFRSTDGGATWRHVDTLPEYSTVSVKFLPANPDIAIATVSEDYRVTNGGGIWRSSDRGVTWTQVHSPESPYGTADRFSAREISIAPDTGTIYVATVFGVSLSTDQGLTWTLADPFGGFYHQVMSVLAQRGGLVLAAGPLGVRRSADRGATWLAPTAGPSGVWDIHALGGSPANAAQVFVIDGSTRLWSSTDSGDHWAQVSSAPTGGGSCGGIAFIKAVQRRIPLLHRSVMRLYLGNRCGAYTLAPPVSPLTGALDLSGAWTTLTIDHGDTRDIAFTAPGWPVLMGTDGGLHKTADGGSTWTFTGGGSAGYNALQVTEVASQRVAGASEVDLYYGTQDNDVRSGLSTDPLWPARLCCEGFFFEMQHEVASAADSQVTFVDCGPCGRLRSGRRFGSLVGWTSPPAPLGDPKILTKSVHVEALDDSATLNRGLGVTTDFGATWKQYARFSESVRALPKLSRIFPSRFRLSDTVLYQAIRTGYDSTRGFEINTLLRTDQYLGSSASVSYPLMHNFGGLGINPTMFAWYQVFAVDPRNPEHLIAPDIVDEKVKESFDGGDNWSHRADLTALVTQSGAFKFRNFMFPIASAISFSEDDPNVVGIGTQQAGLFVSTDRGANWTKVWDSDRATYITSIDWIRPYSAMVSTYGRGLWSLIRIFRVPPIWKYCRLPCWTFPLRPGDEHPNWVDPLWDPVPDKLARTIVVFDGRILGARTVKRQLTELIVTPGSQVVWRSEAELPRLKIRTSTRWQGFANFKGIEAMERRGPIVGLALNAKSVPIGIIGAALPLSSSGLLPQSSAAEEKLPPERRERRSQSPYEDRPSLEIAGAGASTRVVAGAPMLLVVRKLRFEGLVIAQIDGVVVARGKVAAGGSLGMQVAAPTVIGLHTLTLLDERGKIIDGVNFLVVHSDDRRKER